MKYLISGASSELAQAIATNLVSRGHLTTLIGRNTETKFHLESAEVDLPILLETHEVFLHFAHSYEFQDAPDLNELSAHKIVKLLNDPKAKVKKSVYISTDSASAKAISQYGKSKYRTENVFLSSNKCIVIRLGIVVDENLPSPFQILRNVVKTAKILVFPNLKSPNFTCTNISEVTDQLEMISTSNSVGGPFSVKSIPQRLTIIEILRSTGVDPKISIGFPITFTNAICVIAKKFKLTRKVADSISSILVEPEQIRGIPK
jgi:dTDP-4-dehydrorhamnose reductase